MCGIQKVICPLVLNSKLRDTVLYNVVGEMSDNAFSIVNMYDKSILFNILFTYYSLTFSFFGQTIDVSLIKL